MPTQTINISLPKELIKKIDNAARAEFASRSDYIRQALVKKLKVDQAESDDWDLLEALSVEIAKSSEEAGYKTIKILCAQMWKRPRVSWAIPYSLGKRGARRSHSSSPLGVSSAERFAKARSVAAIETANPSSLAVERAWRIIVTARIENKYHIT